MVFPVLSIKEQCCMLPARRLVYFAFFFLLVSTATSNSPAYAFKIDLKKAADNIGNVLKQYAKLPNPVTTPIQIITGNQNPLDLKKYLQQQGQAVSAITVSTRNITNIPFDDAGKVISDLGGDKARVVYEWATGPFRYQNEFNFTLTQNTAAILGGADPLISIAMPLASAMRDAHSKYVAQAKPLPPDVKKTLSPIVPPDILERARYTIGDIKFSLPSAIEGANALLRSITGNQDTFSKDTAVTLDNIIVFPRQPDFNDIDDLVWTGHELYHVKQYRDWGIDLFAFNYLKNHNAVEDQARAAESYARSFLTQLVNNQPINPRITYISATAYAAKTISTPLGAATIMAKHAEANVTPGNPKNGGVLQPVFHDVVDRQFAAYCLINGETLYITKDETIIAPMRGYLPFGRRVKPGIAPQCYFDLQFPIARACAQEISSIDPTTGATLYGYEVYFGTNYAGRCVGCTPETCPQ